MKFTFSPRFHKSHYEQLLRELGDEIDTYRVISGGNVKDVMDTIHISHPVLKKY